MMMMNRVIAAIFRIKLLKVMTAGLLYESLINTFQHSDLFLYFFSFPSCLDIGDSIIKS